MSHKEDSAQESSSSTESSSEESVYEDETLRSIQSDSSDEDIVPYADDPLADSAWTAEYEKEMKENEELEKELKHRLEGRVEVDVWYVSVVLFVISLSITLVFAINSRVFLTFRGMALD